MVGSHQPRELRDLIWGTPPSLGDSQGRFWIEGKAGGGIGGPQLGQGIKLGAREDKSGPSLGLVHMLLNLGLDGMNQGTQREGLKCITWDPNPAGTLGKILPPAQRQCCRRLQTGDQGLGADGSGGGCLG